MQKEHSIPNSFAVTAAPVSYESLVCLTGGSHSVMQMLDGSSHNNADQEHISQQALHVVQNTAIADRTRRKSLTQTRRKMRVFRHWQDITLNASFKFLSWAAKDLGKLST